MTDFEILNQVLSHIDPSAGCMRLIRRNGRVLLALPGQREAAARALRLYQPQRPAGRMMAAGLRLLVATGLHVRIPGPWLPACRHVEMVPPLSGTLPGTCGVMLGSPEHRIRRAIASYRTTAGWEVAKVAFGADGSRLLEREALVLQTLSAKASAVPGCHGLHHGGGVSVLRMPYLTGRPVKPGESAAALALLRSWISSDTLVPAVQFGEWEPIRDTLAGDDAGERVLRRISGMTLRPVICHGDFARWNLLQQPGGGLTVLDWEWGREAGMPGIDLVHYFLQDARLVRRMAAADAIAATIIELERPGCRTYLDETGWSGDPLLPVIACLAYKQGAGHQENREVLDAAVAAARVRCFGWSVNQ